MTTSEGDDVDEKVIVEGSAKLLSGSLDVAFYNPAQQFNRDLTVLVLQQFVEDRREELRLKNLLDDQEIVGKDGDEPFVKRPRRVVARDDAKIRILDALSGTGLRAIRFAKEVPYVAKVVANDISESAANVIKDNIRFNASEGLVVHVLGDAVETMMSHRCSDKRFHVIDVDPYGSASQFFASAVQAVADNGLLMITCTDMAVLCGNTPEACYNKYGCVGLRHKSCHEFAIRVVLKALDTHANCYGRYIVPLLSISVDYYLRIFVRIHTGAAKAKESAAKVSNVFACTGCHTLYLQPLLRRVTTERGEKFLPRTFEAGILNSDGKCVQCGQSVHITGPIYDAPIHESTFVGGLIQRLKAIPEEGRSETYLRMLGILTMIAEELHDVPLYYEYDQLMHIVKSPVPKAVTVRSAVMNAGYRCSIAHCNARALKTDAPVDFLWDIVRTIAKNNKVSIDKFPEDSAGRKILERPVRHQVDFKLHPGAVEKSRRDQLLRFQQNRGKNMGPKARAKAPEVIKQAGMHTKEVNQ